MTTDDIKAALLAATATVPHGWYRHHKGERVLVLFFTSWDSERDTPLIHYLHERDIGNGTAPVFTHTVDDFTKTIWASPGQHLLDEEGNLVPRFRREMP